MKTISQSPNRCCFDVQEVFPVDDLKNKIFRFDYLKVNLELKVLIISFFYH